MADIIDSVISKAATLYNLAMTLDRQELQKKIAELQQELIELQMAYNKLRNENLDLREELDKQQKIAEGKLVFRYSAYYMDGSDEAFCPGCLDGVHKLSRLVPVKGTILTITHKCPVCRNHYTLH
jgi:hypothetical protein